MSHWTDDYQDAKEFFGVKSNPIVKFSIWRDVDKTGSIYPLFVKKEDLRIGDIIFTESENHDGFVVINDFVKDDQGNVTHWQLKDAGFPIERENYMLFVVEKLLKIAVENGIKDTVVMISLKERVENA